MNLPRFSVRRPIFVTMATLIVVLIGLVSLRETKIDLLPSIELPTVSVRTGFDGASPEVMEQLVTQILEEIIATTPGIIELTSSSEEGDSRINVVFEWGTDVDQAAIELQATIEDEINELPDDVDRPRISKFDIDSFPIVILGIASPLDPVELTELVNTQVRYRLTRIPGVAQADTFGGYDRELRVEIEPERLKARGVTIDQILAAVEGANLDRPTGRIEAGRYTVTLRAPAAYASVEEIRETVVARRPDGVVRIRDLGTVRDTYEKLTEYNRVNGERGLRMGIRKKAGANTVEVARAILTELEQINARYPQLEIIPVVNQGNFIQRSIENVARSVLYGSGLAILVLLFFLRNLRSTVIIGLAVPISVIATFALIYGLGLTLNLMTLGGLALGVGMMVDSSIVVLENIFRRREEAGETRIEAAAEGAREVGTAIVASTLTTLVIFLPIVFVEGVSGVLFADFALVIAFSLLCSLLVSLSVVPMLASRFLRSREEAARARPRLQAFLDQSASGLRRLEQAYQRALGPILKHPVRTVAGAAAALAGTLALFPFIGTEFLPPSDEGEIRIDGEMEVGTRLDIVERQTRLMELIVFPAVPEVESSLVEAGEGSGEIRLSLVPVDQRARSNTEIAADLRRRLEGRVPGMDIRVRAPQGQFLLNRLLGGEEDLTVEIRGFAFDVLNGLSEAVADAVRDIPGVTDVDLDFEEGIPQENIAIDRAKVADLGLNPGDVARLLETAIAGVDAGEYRVDGNSYRIFIQLRDAERRSLHEVLALTLQTPAGEAVPLSNLVTAFSSRGPEDIRRKDQQRIAEVRINIAGEDMGTVARAVRERLATVPRPAGYDLRLAGGYEEQQKAFRELLIALLLAVLLVYMVLACQYESLRNPLVVMFSVPTATVGVVLTLLLTGTTLNLQSGIGCVMLAGIVVNSAILLVDQATRLQREGIPLADAVREAGRRRLRPILMTTFTTAFGLLPLALGIGEGADVQAPLARAVVGGLVGSTIITLFLVPAVYVLLGREGPHPDPDPAEATAPGETRAVRQGP
ncbi:MAG: efflux RND transporter permease subunit [Opitutales bacterium]